MEEGDQAPGGTSSGAQDARAEPRASSWLSAILLLGPVMRLGELLIEKTHHRPLGGATFATVVVCGWVVVEFYNKTALHPRRSERRSWRKAAWGIGAASTLAAFCYALF